MTGTSSLQDLSRAKEITMKVIIISSNTLPASPSGPAYVAGAVRQAGHEVTVFESLFATDAASELLAVLKRQLVWCMAMCWIPMHRWAHATLTCVHVSKTW